MKPTWTCEKNGVKGEIFILQYKKKSTRVYCGYATTKNSKIRFHEKETLKEAKDEIYEFCDNYDRAIKARRKTEMVNLSSVILTILIALGFFAGIVLKFVGILLTFMGHYYK